LDFTFKNIIPKGFNSKDVTKSNFWNENLKFSYGENHLIRAESGKGKSTLLAYLIGWRTDFHGDLIINNTNSKKFNKLDWIIKRRNEISWVQQDMQLIPELTLTENLELKNQITSFATNNTIDNYISKLNLQDYINEPCQRLSQGQQQRVAIIRALLQPFKWILLDEPFSHLDHNNKEIAFELIKTCAKEQKAGIVITSLNTKQKLEDFISIDL